MSTTDRATNAQPKPVFSMGQWLRQNPITIKELRGRMRGARAFIVLTVYLLLMSCFATMLYALFVQTAQVSLSTTGGVTGKAVFGGILLVELFLVCFVAPTFTASAISGERERRTYYLLRTTLLSANRLVFGKLAAAMAYTFLLLLAAVPLQSLAFLMGGVTIAEVLISTELLIVTAIGYGSIGLYFSAATKKTLSASAATYAIAMVITLALPVMSGVFTGFFGFWAMSQPSSQIAVEAIFYVLNSLLTYTNPLATAFATETFLQQFGSPWLYTQIFSNGVSLQLPMPWIVYSLMYLALSFLLVQMTARNVRRADV